ncbi:rhomboid family intramembrane serine protease [Nocardioides sp. JQ2195]|uniref:rhomboid family intramembrane serine protease n=1 Tax=Nocardioides sp. JQ2195 TaxID=2592334 RepID=UPI00143EED90|nr:rhomboid family intramembrane serine protease [Nocardioides sp. JQ2195]QIX28306.1 rhomboid family intramembrane serine protease [Nocardioides sp. JQ2195]
MSLPEPRTSPTEATPRWVTAAVVIGSFVALLYAIEFVDTLMSNRLDAEGVRPRETDGLLGIVFAPLLHAGWGHLIGNTIPTLVLGFVILLSGVRTWLVVTAIVWVVGGLGTWLIGQDNSVHIGASVLVFGWLVHLLVRGFFAAKVGQIALGVVILVMYGGILWGVLPGQEGVSWQGHLFGAIGGGLAAWLLAGRAKPQPEVEKRDPLAW